MHAESVPSVRGKMSHLLAPSASMTRLVSLWVAPYSSTKIASSTTSMQSSASTRKSGLGLANRYRISSIGNNSPAIVARLKVRPSSAPSAQSHSTASDVLRCTLSSSVMRMTGLSTSAFSVVTLRTGRTGSR